MGSISAAAVYFNECTEYSTHEKAYSYVSLLEASYAAF
jgi:hypothetical protein